ncbi:MAG: hypothetical protein ACRCVN_07230 [Spirochaetia bacterium]
MSSLNYCQRCRVYVEQGEASCPLCYGQLIHHEQDLPFYSQLPPTAQENESFWEQAPRANFHAIFKRFMILIIFGLFSALLAILGLTWLNKERTNTFPLKYAYTTLSLGYAILIVIFLGYARRFLIFLLSLIIGTLMYLFLLDVADGQAQWFYYRALPIVLAVFVPFFVPTLTWKLMKFKGLNIIGVVCFSAAFSFGLIDLASSSRERFGFSGWSIVVAGILTALAFYCFYLHYYVKYDWHIDRIFHLRRYDADQVNTADRPQK